MTVWQLQQLLLNNYFQDTPVVIDRWECNELFNDIKELGASVDFYRGKQQALEIEIIELKDIVKKLKQEANDE